MAIKREPTPAVAETNADLIVYTAPDGSALYKTRDGMVFPSAEQANEYIEKNSLTILVNEFMEHVEANPALYFGGKKGELPEKERALLALKTRLRNSATLVLSWYLSSE